MNHNAIPRALIWAALAAFTIYSGINLATGPGRDIAYDNLKWTTAAIIEVIAITVLVAGIFARAAYLTFRREVVAPNDGTLRITGAPLNMFGDGFLALVGGVLLLVGAYMVLRIPESLLAASSEQYKGYHSANASSNVMFATLFGGLGFVLMILRRYVWEAKPGKPLRRYWSRPFARGRAVQEPLQLYWTFFYEKQAYEQVAVASWLRAQDPSSRGFFRDMDLVLVPLSTHPDQLAAIEDQWRARLSQVAPVAQTRIAMPQQELFAPPPPSPAPAQHHVHWQ